MPAKKKAPAKKRAAAARKPPSKPAKAKKPTPPPRKASKPAREAPVKPRAPSGPKTLGLGSVPFSGAGRIRWVCEEAKGGVVVKFQPVGCREDVRRVSLDMEFDEIPTGASPGKIHERVVSYQFVPQPGWVNGFEVAVEGVDHAPEVR